MELVLNCTNRPRALLPVPFWAAEIMAFLIEVLPKPQLTRDQVKLMKPTMLRVVIYPDWRTSVLVQIRQKRFCQPICVDIGRHLNKPAWPEANTLSA